jgi:hypothetical protein
MFPTRPIRETFLNVRFGTSFVSFAGTLDEAPLGREKFLRRLLWSSGTSILAIRRTQGPKRVDYR